MELKKLVFYNINDRICFMQTARRVSGDELDLSNLPLLERCERLSPRDPRIDEIRRNIERLSHAVKMKDRSAADRLLVLIEEKVDALIAEISV